MTFRQEAVSWAFPSALDTAGHPEIGKSAPSTKALPLPDASHKAVIVTFLRHCGCPFAEKAYRRLHSTASAHPDISFVAVSHSSPESTDKWLESLALPKDQPNLRIVIDDSRELYAAWGLGPSSFWHVLNPLSFWNMYKLGTEEGIWNRPTETGNRWQTSGSWAVDTDGILKWGSASQNAADVPDLEDAVKAL